MAERMRDETPVGAPEQAGAAVGQRVGTPLPDWVDPAVPAEPGEPRVSLPSGLDRLAGTFGVPVPTLALAAFVRVVGTLAGATEVAIGQATVDGSLALLLVTLPDGSWRDLVSTVRDAGRTAADARPVEGMVDAVFGRGVGPAALLVSIVDCELRVRRDPGRFDAGYAGRVAGYLRQALSAMVADPDARHAGVDLLSEAERRHLVHERSGPVRALPAANVPDLVAAQARRSPGAVAVAHGRDTWTYAELDAAAGQVSRGLRAAGVGREDIVAVSSVRSAAWVAAVLGVLRSGGVYLPIEPDSPAERVATLLEQSGCQHVLTGPAGIAGVAGQWCRPIADLLTAPAPAPPTVPIDPAQLAYVYFTSGSTGLPKGAMCEHGGMLNHLTAKIDDLGLGPDDVVVQNAQQSFDISLWQLAAPLLVGARTLVVSREDVLDIRRFLRTVVGGGATVLQVVPSYLDLLLRHVEQHPTDLGRLRVVSVTGEAVGAPLVRRWFARYPRIALVNAYGATEASDDTTHEMMTAPPPGELVPVGRPVRNVTVYVLGPGDRLLPLGAPGEIAFSGVCVGRGYVNDPARTAEAFAADPFRPGERMYRTGDFGRWLPTGSVEFHGRRDDQVKVNGVRIELGEVESAILAHPRVRTASVLAVPLPGLGKSLAGFYTSPDRLPADELRGWIGRSLPAGAVPARLYQVDALPLTGNGKVDRRRLTEQARLRMDGVRLAGTELAGTALAETALAGSGLAGGGLGGGGPDGGGLAGSGPAGGGLDGGGLDGSGPDGGGPDGGGRGDAERAGADPPRTPTERRLAEAWAGALDLPVAGIGRDDDFFALGGGSLSALRMVGRLGGLISLADLLRAPVLSALAAAADRLGQNGQEPGR